MWVTEKAIYSLANRQYEKSEKNPTTKTVKRNWEIKNIKKLRGFIGNTKQFLSYLTSLIISIQAHSSNSIMPEKWVGNFSKLLNIIIVKKIFLKPTEF